MASEVVGKKLLVQWRLTCPVKESLYFDKSCLVTLEKPADICADLANYEEDLIEVQKSSSRLQGAANLIEKLVPLVLLIYLGPLSDRYGRKMFIMWCLITETVCYIVFLLCSIFMSWPAWVTLVGPFIYSFGSSIGGLQMLLFASIADITTSANRTFRLGILKMSMDYGTPLGRLIGGQIYAAGGYVIAFGCATIATLGCVVYIAFATETLPPEAKKESTISGMGMKNVYLIPKSLVLAVFRKEGHRCSVILLNFLTHFLVFLTLKPPFFLFARYMFDWDATDYSNWLFLKDISSAIVMSLLVPTIIGRIKLPDAAVGMTAAASGAFMHIFLGQIRNKDMMGFMILAPLLGAWEQGAHLATRAMLSKNAAGAQELGKLFATQAILDTASTATAAPMYTAFYNATLETLPSASFLLAAAILTLSVLAFRICGIFIQRREKELATRH